MKPHIREIWQCIGSLVFNQSLCIQANFTVKRPRGDVGRRPRRYSGSNPTSQSAAALPSSSSSTCNRYISMKCHSEKHQRNTLIHLSSRDVLVIFLKCFLAIKTLIVLSSYHCISSYFNFTPNGDFWPQHLTQALHLAEAVGGNGKGEAPIRALLLTCPYLSAN